MFLNVHQSPFSTNTAVSMTLLQHKNCITNRLQNLYNGTITKSTSGYATWFTAVGAIRIALRQLWQTWKLRHYDVITWKL